MQFELSDNAQVNTQTAGDIFTVSGQVALPPRTAHDQLNVDRNLGRFKVGKVAQAKTLVFATEVEFAGRNRC